MWVIVISIGVLVAATVLWIRPEEKLRDKRMEERRNV